MINNLKNVPEIYIKRSRDYQLLLKLLDIITNGVKFNIDKLNDIYDSALINDRFLDFLATIYNFNPHIKFTDDDLRYMLKGFNSMMRNKGTYLGISQAISLAMKTQNIAAQYYISIYNDPQRKAQKEGPLKEENGEVVFTNTIEISNINYYIELEMGDKINRSYLLELLEYVKPIGYTIDIFAVMKKESTTKVSSNDNVVLFINKGNATISGIEMVSRIPSNLEEYTLVKEINPDGPYKPYKHKVVTNYNAVWDDNEETLGKTLNETWDDNAPKYEDIYKYGIDRMSILSDQENTDSDIEDVSDESWASVKSED